MSALTLQEQYIMNEGVMKPLKTKIDLNQTPVLKGSTVHETKDFERYRKVNNKPTSTKIFIKPVGQNEKTGPKWGSPTNQNA